MFTLFWNCNTLYEHGSRINLTNLPKQLLKSYVNCKLSISSNQVESFTEHTKMSLGHENKNIHALHKNIAFLQNKLTENNKIIKSLMET